jgi:hypothetical protein
MASRKPSKTAPPRSLPVSLAPLSFEDALKALVATPPMGVKTPRGRLASRKKPNRKKAD